MNKLGNVFTKSEIKLVADFLGISERHVEAVGAIAEIKIRKPARCPRD